MVITEAQFNLLNSLSGRIQQANAALKMEQEKLEIFIIGLGFEVKEGERYTLNIEKKEDKYNIEKTEASL